jgi:hypothetical protein
LAAQKGKAGKCRPFLTCEADYCAGAGAGCTGVMAPSSAAPSEGAGVMLCVVELSVAGGVVASGVAGVIGCSAAGGLVLWVVVVSVPLSLQAATPKRARAETDARMSFFIISLLHNNAPVSAGGRGENVRRANPFHNVAFRSVTTPLLGQRVKTVVDQSIAV